MINLSNYCVILDSNIIKDSGCKQLAKAEWTNLTEITLSNECVILDENRIGDDGCS
jgi:hypothetical protein